jgi:hypothetical protein
VSVSYGIKENVDIVLGLPYQGFKVTEDGTTVGKENGISDASLELKWRLYEKDGLSIALKPGISFPTGDEEKGLGNGKTGYSLFTIATKEAGPWAFHFNLGYMRNENKFEDRTDLWHASLASELEVQKDLKIVANIGIEKDAASDSDTDPAFILGGLIYSLTDQVNIDAGIKAGLTSTETDYTYLLGLAWSF